MEASSFIIMILMLKLAASHCKANLVFSNQTDKIALFACKDSITEDPFGVLNSWNSSIDVCKWHGVKCEHKHRRVVELDLSSQKLTGSLSPFIGNLSFLRSIYLQGNQFRGNIPQEITRLSRLQNLNFSSNALQGEIPSNLSLCLGLRVVDLSSNELDGKIPTAFGSLSKLTSLYLSANKLHGIIPPSFGNLSLLQNLSLESNNLGGTIPESVGYLRNLVIFSIGENKFSGSLPPSLYNISTLKVLSIPDNRLTGSLPSNIGLTLTNIRKITVGENQFAGRFPASLSNASKLEVLDLCMNGLSGPVPVDLGRRMNDLRWLNLGQNNLGRGVAGELSFVDSLTNCTKLRILELDGNGFGGVLPNSISNLSTELTVLVAGRNQLGGNIPAGITKFINLITLGLERNRLSGSIPFDIGMLQNLQVLNLYHNQLSGSIPESIGNLTRIFSLYLHNNNLNGSFPQNLENIQALQILGLSYNNLAGSIPKTISHFSSLSCINLAHNSFNGSLPLEFGTLNNLEELDLYENNFSGEIPTTLGNCLKLETLLLNSNSFNGSIPSSLASLKGLVLLDLSHNNLLGTIPIDLEKLRFLENLNLSFNNLEGKLPLKGSFSNTSVISIVGNKNLCGGVPELRLPTCPNLESKKHSKRFALKVIIIVVTMALCVVMLLLVVSIYWKRKPRKVASKTLLEEDFLRVSYDQLLKARDRFSLDNLLGIGSFGSVYKGMLQQNEKLIAVKVFNLERLGGSESFITECEILRKIRHRNLLKIITACSSINSEGIDFKALVFEFMQNGSLKSWLHPIEATTRKLNIIQRLSIATDLVSALEYLHYYCEAPIIHCDLKPNNVLLDGDMIAHIGDFGLARLLSINVSNPVEGQTNSIPIKGSIGYVAPEYGMGGLVSTQGDIYSYGILLLEMLTSMRPTNEMFKDGLNLHSFCKMALPDRVMDIVDSHMLISEEELDDGTKAKMRECLISLVRIGVACSVETPNERMGISEIVMELNAIKQCFLGMGNH